MLPLLSRALYCLLRIFLYVIYLFQI